MPPSSTRTAAGSTAPSSTDVPVSAKSAITLIAGTGRPGHDGKVTDYNKDFVRIDQGQMHWARRKQLIKLHPEVETLYEPDRMTSVYLVLIVIGTLALSYFMRDKPWWAVLSVGYVIGAPACHATWVIVHDLTHNAAFSSNFWNLFMHLIANLHIIYPSTISFRKYHLMHHAYLNETYQDPDLPSPFEADTFGNSALGKGLWLLGFPIFQGIRMLRYAQEDIGGYWLVANFVLQGLLSAYVSYFWGVKAIVFLMFASYFALSFHPLGARWVAEHYSFAPDQETYSYYGWANRIAFNIGFHNEHHDLPRVPWSKLPAVKKIAPEFYEPLASHNSYRQVLYQFLFNPNFTLKSRVVRNPARERKSD
mmetsp:Transcript_34253/g.55402  ORF Transcript_34253/g.55402 Transcript_34253/m.55402 type:complete len:364 (-) Transcript_34253:672-1763(-)|eukprot:CAMPEP_0184646528 /NCGR_PEP_ID=MMETSP0308-20130426/3219_1 /TAXON_ID=38269 /ORGANISM="Gloeochaete witrockiana, Strain SAG 46.84" /LENGTH=363 /DNA_ID=CAMNT_0027076597 /DNA_START=121 /DNA_END=1212 /DNA_ORIENTATION=-